MRNIERSIPKDSFDYLSVVGSLLHISNCLRPDISYAVGNLARFANAPGAAHVRAAKRVLQYLYQSRTLGITYYRDCDQQRNVPLMYEGAKHPLDNGINKTQVFADSDYAADETRRSTMGGIVMQNGGPISWFSTLGKTVALSTCEAEINAAVTARTTDRAGRAPTRPLCDTRPKGGWASFSFFCSVSLSLSLSYIQKTAGPKAFLMSRLPLLEYS